jgi:hypothetical protein
MMRKQTLAKVAVLTMGIVLLATTASEAQRRKQQRGNRQRGGQFGGFNRNPLAILENETLQKELGLTTAQKQRVKELSLQMQGTAAITTEPVSQALGVSDTQKAKMTEIRTASREKFRGLFGGGRRGGNGGQRPDFTEIRKKMAEIQAGVDKEILGVLTSSQKAKWTKMLGKPADVSKLRPTFGGGRRGGQGRKKRPDSNI